MFFLVGLKIKGPGLDGVCSIYQGHLFVQKATYGQRSMADGRSLKSHNLLCFSGMFGAGEVSVHVNHRRTQVAVLSASADLAVDTFCSFTTTSASRNMGKNWVD